MRRAEAFEDLRMMKFRSVFSWRECDAFSQLEAAELLGVGERTFRLWCGRYSESGETGLADRLLGQVTANRVPADWAIAIEALCLGRSP
jgi:transposase